MIFNERLNHKYFSLEGEILRDTLNVDEIKNLGTRVKSRPVSIVQHMLYHINFNAYCVEKRYTSTV